MFIYSSCNSSVFIHHSVRVMSFFIHSFFLSLLHFTSFPFIFYDLLFVFSLWLSYFPFNPRLSDFRHFFFSCSQSVIFWLRQPATSGVRTSASRPHVQNISNSTVDTNKKPWGYLITKATTAAGAASIAWNQNAALSTIRQTMSFF